MGAFSNIPIRKNGAVISVDASWWNSLRTAGINVESRIESLEDGTVALKSYTDDAAFESDNGVATAGDIYFNSTIDRVRYFTGIAWRDVGSGAGSSGINYLEGNDSNFEDGVGNWFTDDGSGLPSSTFNLYREGTSPLVGLGSLRIAKAAASANGHRVANDHVRTIDKAFRGMVLWGELEGDFSHSNYASNDLTIQAYDVTNGALIPAWVEGGTGGGFNSGKGKYIFRVATSTTTAQIQLRIRGNSTNAMAYDVYVDEIKLGPQEYVIGASIGDWVPFTGVWSTQSGSLPSTSVTATFKKYVGDEVWIKFYRAFSGSGSGSGWHILNLPDNLEVDDVKNGVGGGTGGQGSIDGGSWYDNSNTTPGGFSLTGHVYSTNQVALIGSNGDQNAINSNLASGDRFAGILRIPIKNRSSNTVLSNSRVEYVYNSSTSTSSDSTSFGYGSNGAPIQAFSPSGTTAISKRTRFNSPKKYKWVEIFDGVDWTPLACTELGFTTNDAGTTYYGILLRNISSTDCDVRFFSAPIPGTTWSSLNSSGWAWRVVGSDNPLAVETAPKIDLESKGSLAAYSISVNTYGDLTSLTLPPGRFTLDAQALFDSNGATTTGQINLGISTNPGNDSSGMITGDNNMQINKNSTSGSRDCVYVVGLKVDVVTPTTYYLKSYAATSTTNLRVAYRINARSR